MSYQIIDEKIVGKTVSADGSFMQMKLMHIVCDSSVSIPEPRPEWSAGSRCDVLADSGAVYILSISREWKQVNFYNWGGSGGDFDPDSYYTKPQTDARITEKVAEIVADAPQDFDTLKEISDWISSHEDSAAAMNSAIQANATAITGKVDKVSGKGLSTEDYTTSEKTKLSGIASNATNIGKLYPNSTNGEIFNSYSGNKASGNYSHAEGLNTNASGNYSHTEGNNTVASGGYSHAEGNATTASGSYSHTEGNHCAAYASCSHASGQYTIANATAQTAIGRYNVSDDNAKYAFIIGNGSNTNARSNAFAVDWNGLIYVGNSATGVDVTNLVEKEQGKGLSTEDYTTAEKTKLAGIEAGAEANIQSDWEQSDSTADDFIKNKPTLGSAASRSVVLSLSNAGSGLPTSGTVYSALENKVDKVTGKGLSTEDYTTAEKNKLAVLSELNTATVTIDLNSQTWTESANGLFYTGNISVTNLYRALSAIITGFSALKPTDNVAVIANSDKTAIRLTASTNTFSNQANITVSVFGRFTS